MNVSGDTCLFLAQAAGQQGNPTIFLVGYVAIFGVMIFFFFRAQKKEAKKRQKMIEEVKTGDRVITTGGIYGIISNVKEKSFMVKIADNVKVEVSKAGVTGVLGKDEGEVK